MKNIKMKKFILYYVNCSKIASTLSCERLNLTGLRKPPRFSKVSVLSITAISFMILLFTFINYNSFGQTTTIDFETAGSGYTPSTTWGTPGNIDCFDRTNVGVNGNSSYYWPFLVDVIPPRWGSVQRGNACDLRVPPIFEGCGDRPQPMSGPSAMTIQPVGESFFIMMGRLGPISESILPEFSKLCGDFRRAPFLLQDIRIRTSRS